MAKTNWTNEQLQAINSRECNLLIAAAAGSGKTAVLVERIIKIITNKDNPISIDKLLVVTFTNAAATEMRERIGDAIIKQLDINPNSTVLQRQLALLNRANITTIHSFCLDVIKNNFHLIDLDPNFRIGDETECELIKQDIINDLFESKYDNDDYEFLNLVEAYSNGKDDTKLQEIVFKLYKFSMSGPNPEKWLYKNAEQFNMSNIDDIIKSTWWSVIKDRIKYDLYVSSRLLEKALDLCQYDQELEAYTNTLRGDIEMISQLNDVLSRDIDNIYNTFILMQFSKMKAIRGKILNVESKEMAKALRDEAKKKIESIKKDIFSFSPDEMLEGIKNCYKPISKLVELTVDFINLYTVKKREKGILDFNDLEHLCIDILLQDNKPSSVAEKLKEKFEEVLVDEYQDSNNVQETIIDLVSRKNRNIPNVFMVGDVKQSIYRFRQAKPELFLEKYNSYSSEDESKNKKILLYKNFRSRKEVINGVNYIFKQLMSKSIGEIDYTDKEALNLGANYPEINNENILNLDNLDIEKIDNNNNIEVNILDKDVEETLDENDECSEDKEEDVTSIQLEARIIVNRIKEIISSKNKINVVWDKSINKYRPVDYKDIVILLRATKNWAEVFSEELGIARIPVYTDVGTGYFQATEIKTILSLLHIIDNPLQDIELLAVLKSPIFSFTPEELTDLRLINRENYFYHNVKEVCNTNDANINLELKNKCKYFIESLNKWREKVLYTPIDEFIWYLYSDTSYYSYVGAMPNGVQRQANLRILFQRAKQFETISFKGIFNFINFINKVRNSSGDMGSAKILSENENVVRIMSIHKSKGLEFPIVFLAGTGKQFNLMDLNDDILIHDELGFGPNCINVEKRISYKTIAKNAIRQKCKLESLSEEMRVLYVAFTRAKEKLIITGAKAKLDKTFDNWCNCALLSDEKILPSEILKGKCFLDWIGMALAKHKQGEEIRKGYNKNISILSQELSTWEVKLWRKSDLSVDEEDNVVDKYNENLFINKDGKIEREILKRLNFKYRFLESTALPSNVSVSDLKLKNDTEDRNDTLEIFKEENSRKPKFLSEKEGLTGAQKGTIIHFAMQHLDLNKINNTSEIKIQINQMIEDELITLEEAKVIYIPSILKFFKSNLGERMIKAYKEGNMIKREFPFFTEISATMVNENLPKEIYQNEKIRLQGIMDCFFEENKELVLLDYKTDYVEQGKIQEIKEKYELQIKYYSETLEKITGKKVKNKYLYLFYNGEIVEY